ncbi:MAG: hypothetical protein SFW67_19395 [Myxococcaceae bacterium]|nr:hypothetical protein [Myxococcaceae bacterium]
MGVREVKEKAAKLVAQGQLDRAEVLLRQVLTQTPRDAQTWLKHAEVLKRLSRPADAVASYRLAARILDDEGHHPRAAAALKLALTLLPDDIDLITDVIRSEMKTRKGQAAVRSVFPISSPSQLLAAVPASSPSAIARDAEGLQLALPSAPARVDALGRESDRRASETSGALVDSAATANSPGDAPSGDARTFDSTHAGDRPTAEVGLDEVVNQDAGDGRGPRAHDSTRAGDRPAALAGLDQDVTEDTGDGGRGPRAHDSTHAGDRPTALAGLDQDVTEYTGDGGRGPRAHDSTHVGDRSTALAGLDEVVNQDAGDGRASGPADSVRSPGSHQRLVSRLPDAGLPEGIAPDAAGAGHLSPAGNGDEAPGAFELIVPDVLTTSPAASHGASHEPVAPRDALDLLVRDTLGARRSEPPAGEAHVRPSSPVGASPQDPDADSGFALEVRAGPDVWPQVRRLSARAVAIRPAPGARWVVISGDLLEVRFTDELDVPEDAEWLE